MSIKATICTNSNWQNKGYRARARAREINEVLVYDSKRRQNGPRKKIVTLVVGTIAIAISQWLFSSLPRSQHNFHRCCCCCVFVFTSQRKTMKSSSHTGARTDNKESVSAKQPKNTHSHAHRSMSEYVSGERNVNERTRARYIRSDQRSYTLG